MERKRFCNAIVTVALSAALAAALSAPGLVGAEEGVEPSSAEFVVESSTGVVAADHPIASRTGAEVLGKGGNAVDAAITSLLTLGVVNPFSSGLGGGGFCLTRMPDGEVDVIDFRERAPGRATRDMYLEDGEVVTDRLLYGGLAVGVPGEPRGLEALHQKHGALGWSDVVSPAYDLAVKGFPAGEKLAGVLVKRSDRLEPHKALAKVFQRDGAWVRTGDRVKRPGLARALAMLRDEGAEPFYEGKIAQSIVARVNSEGGIFEPSDLTRYRVTWREPVRGTYRGYEVLSMPPPSSGGTTILATLNILERYDLATLGYNPESMHRVTEALKHAFADRATWLGDADFVEVPVERITSKPYAAERTVHPDATLATDKYGTSAQVADDGGTTHVSVIDAAGGMAACTSTVNTEFGSLVFVEEYGLVMNNEMADFTARPGVPNNFGLVGTEQNAVAPGKRPLSSMSPTLVLKEDEPFMAVGASGGPRIITGTLLAILRTIDWGWSPADAVAAPRFHHQWRPNILRVEDVPESWATVLKSRGHEMERWDAYNSVQMVLRQTDGSLVGVSDPRKHGRPAAAPAKQ